MANKTWSMNDTQKQFCDILATYENGATLLDIKLDKGIEFKTGSINTLIVKGLITAEKEKEYKCDVVFNGVKIGTLTKTQKVYTIVK